MADLHLTAIRKLYSLSRYHADNYSRISGLPQCIPKGHRSISNVFGEQGTDDTTPSAWSEAATLVPLHHHHALEYASRHLPAATSIFPLGALLRHLVDDRHQFCHALVTLFGGALTGKGPYESQNLSPWVGLALAAIDESILLRPNETPTTHASYLC